MQTKKLSALQELALEVETKAIPSLIRYVKEFEENIVIKNHLNKDILFTIIYIDYDDEEFCNQLALNEPPINYYGQHQYESIRNFLYSHELTKEELSYLHLHDFDRLKSIIKTAELWHKKYKEIDDLMDICEKVDIKIATRELLFEKYQEN